MSNQLFKGQTNHALSHEELVVLSQKSTLFCKKSESKFYGLKLIETFVRLNQTATGRETLRHILNAKNEYRYSIKGQIHSQDLSPIDDENEDDILNDHIFINPSIYQMPFGEIFAAIFLAHETIHDIQKHGKNITDLQAGDAETQALNAQLSYEFGVIDVCQIGIPHNYIDVYQENALKWESISKGENPTPKGMLKFEPMPNADKELARKAYIAQMASQETRATYVRDFVRIGIENPQNANPPFVFTDVAFQYMTTTYRQKGDQIQFTVDISEQTVDDYRSRNPFISQKDFNPLRKYLGKEIVSTNKENNTNKQNNHTTNIDMFIEKNNKNETDNNSAPATQKPTG